LLFITKIILHFLIYIVNRWLQEDRDNMTGSNSAVFVLTHVLTVFFLYLKSYY